MELAGGRAARGIIDNYPGKAGPELIPVTPREVERLCGLSVSLPQVIEVLRALGFECQEANSGSRILVSVPYWRSDIKCPADLVEEVVRIIGYDKVPVTRLGSPLPPQKSKFSSEARWSYLKEKVCNILVACGFQEILTYSLVSLEKLQKLSPKLELRLLPLRVANPMTKEQEYLRTSLRAGLLATLARNQKFEDSGIRLFEIGKVFLPRGEDLPEEKEMLCAVLCGPRHELSWHGDKESLDIFDAKGVVERVLDELRLDASFENSNDEALLPGRGANIVVHGDRIGVLGELHPEVAQAFEVSGTVCLIEMELEKLLAKLGRTKKYQPIPRFPSVTRDIALVVDEGITYKEVEEVIRGFPSVTRVTLFDVYRGQQIPAGKKSFAVRVVYQSPDRTLTDQEIDQTQEQMLARLQQELGATLRG